MEFSGVIRASKDCKCQRYSLFTTVTSMQAMGRTEAVSRRIPLFVKEKCKFGGQNNLWREIKHRRSNSTSSPPCLWKETLHYKRSQYGLHATA